MKKKALPLLFLLSSACGLRAPIAHRVTVDVDRDGEHARVTVVTDLARGDNEEMNRRLADAREALQMGRDEWSNRFSGVTLDSERTTLEKDRGELRRVEHVGVMRRDDLQRFFGDTPILTKFTRGDGWSELSVYAGSTARATRQQREEVQQVLDVWSRNAARYVNAMSRLYEFLDAHPQRAVDDFDLLFADAGTAHALDEEEDALVNGARDAMDRLSGQFDAARKSAWSVDEEFDLVYNPFPAEIVIRAPHAVRAFENFAKRGDDTVYIHRSGLLDAIKALDGKWLSPDPLAMLLRADEEHAEMPASRDLAAMPRKGSHVEAREIEEAVVSAITPKSVYRVRWNESQ